MRDRFNFADGQDLNGLTNTGVVSEHIWDLEQDDSDNVMETDSQVVGWINVLFRSNNAGATEGLWIEVNSSSDTAGTADIINLGIIRLTDAELTAAAGKTFSIGVNKAGLERYISLWFDPISTALAGNETLVDAYFNINPEALEVIQKKPS